MVFTTLKIIDHHQKLPSAIDIFRSEVVENRPRHTDPPGAEVSSSLHQFQCISEKIEKSWNKLITFNHQITNNVLLVKIEGVVWYTIYHHLPVVKGLLQTPLLINQKKEKDIYAEFTYSSTWFCQPKTHRLRDSQLTEGSIDTNQRDPVNIPHL